MGKGKKYSGYKSFQYLDEGIDYKAFKLAKEIGRTGKYVVPLSKSEEGRVERILEKQIVLSLHDHLYILTENTTQIPEYNREGRKRTAYEALSISGLDAVFDNFGSCAVTSKMGWKWTDVIHELGMRLSDLAHQDFVVKAEGVNDIFRAHEEGKVALILSLEAATAIENEVDRIDILYGFGVRMMGVAYSGSNMLGSGQEEDRDGGLTHFGHKAVKRMNNIGMAIDVAHSGDRTALDVIEASEKPVFISHSGARALCVDDMPNFRRMAPDEVIKGCAEKGGIIGIEAAPHQTITKNHTEHTIESVMEHFEYCKDLVGIDHVAFGPDTLFGDHVGLHRAFSEQFFVKSSGIKEVAFVRGMENPSENFPNIVRWLVKEGYSDHDIEKVIGGNIIRALKEVWQK